ncbi:MAG: ankyrin repeat domain-containing protein [Terriglobales bacterium]|jgi:ankyrin repeat protein
MENSQPAFELLTTGDAVALSRFLEQNPTASEARDANGVTLLMQSLYRGQRELAELIASKKSALDLFEATSLGRLDRIQVCLDQAGAREANGVSARSSDGFTALHFACFFRQPEAARLLLASGAAPDAVATNSMQVMPLHSAASARNLEAARLLLEHGAPVNARQQGGWTPIHAAAGNGDRALVELLLKHHADPQLANDEGKTPAMTARESGHDEIAALLLATPDEAIA